MKTVLIMSADPRRARSLALCLHRRRLFTLTAPSTPVAMDMMHCVRPDLLVADATLPTSDAASLCECLREQDLLAGCPMVLLTPADARAQAAAYSTAETLDGTHVIVCPARSTRRILRCVMHCLGGGAATAEPAAALH